MPHGVIKYFDPHKGIGFIQRADGQPDIFVRISNRAEPDIVAFVRGQRVRFEERADTRSGKPEAVNVVVL